MLYQRMNQLMEMNPQAPAILLENEEVSYQDFIKEVDKLVDAFRKLNLDGSTPLAITINKSEVIWSAVIAASHLGISVMLVDPNLKEEEMNKLMTLYKPHFQLSEDNKPEWQAESASQLECFGSTFWLKDIGKHAQCWDEYVNPPNHETYFVLLTSGSTKVPSAVVKTVSSVMADGEQIGISLGITSEDRVLCAAPVYHAFGSICGCFATFLRGASVSFIGAYVLPSSLENRMYKRDCNILMALPAHYKMIVKHVERPLDQIRFALSSTAPLTKEVIDYCKEQLNLPIYNIYGSSEAGAISIQKNHLFDSQAVNLGQPVTGVHVKFDSSDVSEFHGEVVSELLIKSQSLAKGYLQVEGIDDNEFAMEDGWWRTGDLGYLDQNKELNIVGRVKTTINVNGKKVNAYEIEEVLSRHAAVLEVVVVGIPDTTRGEIPVAFVVLKESVTEIELLKYCQLHLSDYKVPRQIVIKDSLPKTATGKIRRKEVHI
ncbi:class I adenylate-forming enzyme family protein [Paenibacillus sp. 481]|uniref:class I adenylate-forming enzyme family protein n=1 Tax=Paenibacillus sp. 481 TaxID=2835869 RepID=UPI001E3F79CB|nr:class I adenylate-forming enzyme family protein [Paenibacillus sp. 481]UHA72030.1 acyl--CoA ligase [Paenibacillus sp. 481]